MTSPDIPDDLSGMPDPSLRVREEDADHIDTIIAALHDELPAACVSIVIIPAGLDNGDPDIRMRLDAHAYPDVAALADHLEGMANTIREQQGEINADTHRRIVEEGQ
ncbi:hypothetical protein C6V83_00050 [Gordonia iterans]|uniref:Uncharacterized protein n=1 Tax=Gordonia iterans TaxID=1004901 RepID=A0A2S0KB78_9ACTN|nr:hypothetical protein [Gordonia iterans]AVL98908.1 hypothetical protein C6V83_00050 [Gordonia iterans]